MTPAARRRVAAAAFLGAIAWMPRAAAACAVCMAGYNDETRRAFLASTAIMSLLPLLLIGGLAWWIWRRSRAHRAAMRGAPERPTAEVATRTSSAP